MILIGSLFQIQVIFKIIRLINKYKILSLTWFEIYLLSKFFLQKYDYM